MLDKEYAGSVAFDRCENPRIRTWIFSDLGNRQGEKADFALKELPRRGFYGNTEWSGRAKKRKMPKGFITVNEIYCKGCGLCVEVCPEGILDLAVRLNRMGYHPAEKKSDTCSGCANCALVCPEAAITVKREIPVSRIHARLKEKPGSKIGE